jgi:acrylyl-CoA reductase (NADPH)
MTNDETPNDEFLAERIAMKITLNGEKREFEAPQTVKSLLAAVGLAGGSLVPASIIPFLLRGINLLGIDSVLRPYEDRVRAWDRIARDLPLDKLEAMIRPASLAELPDLGAAILKGEVQGRVVVDVNA